MGMEAHEIKQKAVKSIRIERYINLHYIKKETGGQWWKISPC
jgi:hypothetical protein